MEHKLTLLKQVRAFIPEGKTQEAIHLINSGAFEKFSKEGTLISNRWEELKRQKIQGIISQEQLDLTRNRINSDLFDLTERIKLSITQPIKKSNLAPLAFGITLCFLLMGAAMFYFSTLGTANQVQPETKEIIEIPKEVEPIEPEEQPDLEQNLKADIIKRCESKYPDSFETFNDMDIGKCLITNGQFDEGIKYVKKIRSMVNSNEETNLYYTSIGKIYRDAKDVSNAILYYDSSYLVFPTPFVKNTLLELNDSPVAEN